MAIAQLVELQIALHVAVVLAVIADMDLIRLRRIQPHPTPREAAEVMAGDPVKPRSRVGREQAHLLSTRLRKCGHSRRFEKA